MIMVFILIYFAGMRVGWAHRVLVLMCSLFLVGHLYLYLTLEKQPNILETVIPVMEHISHSIQVGFVGAKDIVLIQATIISLIIGYTSAYGSISWMLHEMFPNGSKLASIQSWDALPLFIPVLEMTKNTVIVLRRIQGKDAMVDWKFWWQWINYLHYGVFWASIVLLLCVPIHAAVAHFTVPIIPPIQTDKLKKA